MNNLQKNNPVGRVCELDSWDSAQAVILKCDCNAGQRHQAAAPDEFPPILYSMGCRRRGGALGGCGADAGGCAVDRPAYDSGAHAAPLAGLDSRRALSRTLRIRSAAPNLT